MGGGNGSSCPKCDIRDHTVEPAWWVAGWHGNLHRAIPAANYLQDDVEGLEVDYPLRRKFARAAREFAVYIETNTDSLIHYG